MLIIFMVGMLTGDSISSVLADERIATQAAVFRNDVAPLLKGYCINCHGATKPEAELSLQDLSGTPVGKSALEIWSRVADKIESGEMPPREADQPPVEQRFRMVRWIKQTLRNAGVVDERSAAPSRGNWIDHDALFSSKPVEVAGGSATQARLWRLSGQAYEEFIQQKNLQFKLGFRNYGDHKIRSPWNFTPQWDFSDYAASHRIGEAEIEYHMRNATAVAKALVKRMAGRKPSPGYSDWIAELNVVLTAAEETTDKQAKSATTATFESLLERAPSERESKRYSEFLVSNIKLLGVERAVEHFLVAVLFQPEVTYRVELLSDGSSRRMLSPRALARSLAFALTDLRPDAELGRAARDGKLTTREQAQAQVERMLDDGDLDKPRILRFFQEYFGHHAAKDVFKDQVTIVETLGSGERNSWHPYYFVSDADRLIEWVLRNDRDVLRELLTTNKTFALTLDPKIRDKQAERSQDRIKYADRLRNKPFQNHEKLPIKIYEIAIEKPEEWFPDRPYDMPAGHRMGILSHPAWLIAQSGNFDNHAIHRGRWIREKLLGGHVPEVPITVNAMLPDEPHRPLRDRMSVTREEYCWNCHRQMDPLGLAFEQFDHFGRYRTEEQVVDVEATNDKRNLNKDGRPRQRKFKHVPVDTTGHVEQSGDPELDGPVDGPFELIRKLAASTRVEQVFVRHAFRYFLGRNETFDDGPALVAAHRAYVENGGSMKALITSLLTSDAFLYRARN
jgi:hypothetical protein